MTGSNIQTLDEGRVVAAADFVSLLRANGLDTFEKIMAHRGGKTMRAVPGRSTVRVELDGLVAYLKRYESGYLNWRQRLLRFLHWPGHDDEALHEWRMLHRLHEHGLPAPTPIAAGQRTTCGIVTRSFVMTADIAGGIQGDDYVKTLGVRERRAFAAELASLARRFHDEGFIHKDFYLAHVFVVERDGRRELFCIDLQRVLGPRRFARRWLIKDLAALGHSAQRIGVPRTDLLRFLRSYCGEKIDTALARRIMKRMARVARRRPKYVGVWNDPESSKAEF